MHELPRRGLLGNTGHEKSRGLVYPGSILQIILLTSISGSATNYYFLRWGRLPNDSTDQQPTADEQGASAQYHQRGVLRGDAAGLGHLGLLGFLLLFLLLLRRGLRGLYFLLLRVTYTLLSLLQLLFGLRGFRSLLFDDLFSFLLLFLGVLGRRGQGGAGGHRHHPEDGCHKQQSNTSHCSTSFYTRNSRRVAWTLSELLIPKPVL